MADSNPLGGIICPHQGLTPEGRAGEGRRAVVSREVWGWLKRWAEEGRRRGEEERVREAEERAREESESVQEGDKSLRKEESLSEGEQCTGKEEGKSLASKGADTKQAAITEVKEEKEEHDEPVSEAPTKQEEPTGYPYALIPSSWVALWRSSLSASPFAAKSAAAVASGCDGGTVATAGAAAGCGGMAAACQQSPPSLDGALRAVRCQQHGGLVAALPCSPSLDGALRAVRHKQHGGLVAALPVLVSSRKGELLQANSESEPFTIVTRSEWDELSSQWGGTAGSAIRARIKSNPPSNNHAPDSKSSESHKSASHSQKSAVGKNQNHPSVTVGKSRRDQSFPTPYCLETIPSLCHICYKNPEEIAEEERAMREELQRGDYREEEIVVELVRGSEPPPSVVASTTEEITDLEDHEGLTMVQAGVFAGARLWVVDTKLHKDRDIAEELPVVDDTQKEEAGFKGTGLAGGFPVTSFTVADAPKVAADASTVAAEDVKSGADDAADGPVVL
ncbi:unnamed protein product [Closterium sp. Yama58-4]|nr:unnamed protein product [Closterium sp. Yama58-4]